MSLFYYHRSWNPWSRYEQPQCRNSAFPWALTQAGVFKQGNGKDLGKGGLFGLLLNSGGVVEGGKAETGLL